MDRKGYTVTMRLRIFAALTFASLLFFAIFVVMLWVATARPIYPLSALVLFSGGAFAAYHLFGYVRARFQVWLDPFAQSQGHGYQIVQSLFALATGGVFGTGLGLRNSFYFRYEQPDLINLKEEFVKGLGSVKVQWTFAGNRIFYLASRDLTDANNTGWQAVGTWTVQ